MTTELGKPIGYWFRFGTARDARLHLTKWLDAPEGVMFSTACGSSVIPQPAYPPLDLKLLKLQPTAIDALRSMDQNQRSRLCPACARRYTT